MRIEEEAMRAFFQAVVDHPDPTSEPTLDIYRFQIRYRRLSIPSEIFFPRLQNIWGREFIWQLLEDFFQDHPPASTRWEKVLEALSGFIRRHPDYSRVLALADMVEFSLQVWTCLHSKGLSASHDPGDPIDLFELWKRSETQQEGDPEAFWEAITRGGRRGCLLQKVTPDEWRVQPFTLASPSKIL